MPHVYPAGQCSVLDAPFCVDPDSRLFFSFIWRPNNWAPTTVYRQAGDNSELGDLVTPVSPNGYIAACISSGLSDASEPTLGTQKGATVTDGGCLWKMLPDDCEIFPGDTIDTATWTTDPATVTVGLDAVESNITVVKGTDIPAGVTSFTLTCELDVTRASGKVEKLQRSIKVTVGDK